MIKFNIDIATLSETNLHLSNPQVNKKIQRVVRKFWSRKTLITSETDILWQAKYKLGGTTTITTNALNNKVTKPGQDPEGSGR